mmetsp:Transcript_15047/g.17502  ORF Transcript_15047/g.17502 Transcript_15047/m.17502 type:complete len:700 (+) Transcript_15047:65-2164(+)
MPNARVGAMPQHNQQDGRARRERKGITMEDLKHQTAARLAKEQRRRNAAAASKNARNGGKMYASQEQISGFTGSHDPSSASVGGNSVDSFSHHSQGHQSQARSRHSAQSSTGGTSASRYQYGYYDTQSEASAMSGSATAQKNVYSSGHQMMNSQPQETRFAPSSQQQFYLNGQAPDQETNTPQRSNAHHHQQKNKLNQHQPGSTKKLPHGLTVQELKEMTKARLAAEASEGKESAKSSDSVETEGARSQPKNVKNRVCSQDSFGEELNRQRIQSVDSFGSLRQRLGSSESFGSSHSTTMQHANRRTNDQNLSHAQTHAHQTFHNTNFGSQHHAPSKFQNYHQEAPPVTSLSYDTLDTVSVNSFTSGLGSESIFGSDASGFYTTTTAATRGELRSTRSFPIDEEHSSNDFDRDDTASKIKSRSFETGLAIKHTMSPPTLSQLSENRASRFCGLALPFIQGSPPSETSDNRSTVHQQDEWNGTLTSPMSSSSIHTTGQSSCNLKGSAIEAPSFMSLPMMGKLERIVSSGAQLPNSVAESVLDNDADLHADIFHDYKSVFCAGKDLSVSPNKYPWSSDVPSEAQDKNDFTMSNFQSEWQSMLKLSENDGADDFPLSTFTSKATANKFSEDKASSNIDNMFSQSSFITNVSEEQQRIAAGRRMFSADENVPENFNDDCSSEILACSPKQLHKRRSGGSWRKKK